MRQMADYDKLDRGHRGPAKAERLSLHKDRVPLRVSMTAYSPSTEPTFKLTR